MTGKQEFDMSVYMSALDRLVLGAALDGVTQTKSRYMADIEDELLAEERYGEFNREITKAHGDAFVYSGRRIIELTDMVDEVFAGAGFNEEQEG